MTDPTPTPDSEMPSKVASVEGWSPVPTPTPERPRWYGNTLRSAHPQGRIQNDGRDRRHLPMPILELAWQEYDAQGHGRQSLDRIQERGGFGLLEVVSLLADRCERLERARRPRDV